MHIHFLHGFLGLPIDWSPLLLHLKSHFESRAPQFHLHNLWNDLESMPDPSLKNWGLQFAQKLPPSGNILIGYSMGGRLAMHFPVWEQRKIDAIILIAAHPGLITAEEKSVRQQEDEKWAKLFGEGVWETVVRDWNAQPVFVFDRIRPPRREKDFSRPLLVKALRNWSLAQQEDMIPRLQEFQCPIYYFHGAKDEKFSVLARRIKSHSPKVQVKIIDGAGHCPHFSHSGDVVKLLAPLLVPKVTSLV